MASRTQRTVWASGCDSWYLGEDGRNFTLWPGFTFEYWWRTRDLDVGDYDIHRPRTPGRQVPGRTTLPTVS